MTCGVGGVGKRRLERHLAAMDVKVTKVNTTLTTTAAAASKQASKLAFSIKPYYR
jgi:hypothetical protein